jgi:hypothetical protein
LDQALRIRDEDSVTGVDDVGGFDVALDQIFLFIPRNLRVDTVRRDAAFRIGIKEAVERVAHCCGK